VANAYSGFILCDFVPLWFYMKVCIISPDFPPVPGGVSDYVYHLASELGRSSNLTIITTRKAKSSVYELYPVFDSFSMYEYVQALRIIHKLNPDTVNIQYTAYLYGWWRFELVFFLALCRLFLRSQLVVTFHELCDPLFISPVNFVRSLIHRLKLPFLLLLSEKIVVTTKTRYEVLKRLLILNKVYIATIGVNIKKLPLNRPLLSTLKKRYRISPDETVFSMFGTVSGDKDYETLFLALKGLKAKWKLLVVGSSSEKRYKKPYLLAKRLGLNKNIVWTGFLPEQEVSAILQLSDIYLIPYTHGVAGRFGTFPVGFEFGLPTITTIGRDTPQFLKNGENLLLVQKRDFKELGAAINKLVQDRDLRQRLAMNGRKTFENYYLWSNIAKEMVEIWKD